MNILLSAFLLTLSFCCSIGDTKPAEEPAVEFVGNWWIKEGKSPDGKDYEGNAKIIQLDSTFMLRRATMSASHAGVGLREGQNLFFAWGKAGTHGIIVYKIDEEKLEGRWTDARSGGMTGTETIALSKKGELVGKHTLTGTNSSGAGTYKMDMEISQEGELYHLVWSAGGNSYKGIGVVADGVLSAAFSMDGSHVFGHYKLSGDRLDGRWVAQGSSVFASEKMRH
jgi:hypothetical protein